MDYNEHSLSDPFGGPGQELPSDPHCAPLLQGPSGIKVDSVPNLHEKVWYGVTF